MEVAIYGEKTEKLRSAFDSSNGKGDKNWNQDSKS